MALAPDIVAGVARRLAEHAGLELPAWVIEARTAARAAALGVDGGAYLALIQSGRGAAELDELLEAVRVGESSLFRHRSQIATLAEVVAPKLRESGRRAIRVWSAGCAAGEEPYTLAAVLARALPGCAVSILATDVSAGALAAAAEGAYPRAALDDVPAEWRDAFVVDGDRVRVKPEIARLVRFERANLVDGAAPRGCDLVWCRNVLIYFTQAARAAAIERLVAATVAGGYIFVGYSESLREVADLEAQRAGETVYYMKRSSDRASRTELRTPPIGTPVARASAPLVRGSAPTPPAALPAVATVAAAPVALTPTSDVVALSGTPDAASLTAMLSARLAAPGLRRLIVDLDAADLLADELASVVRRARAAANAAGVALELRATRTGPRRWLTRHNLDDGGAP